MENITTATAETYSFNGSLETEESKKVNFEFSSIFKDIQVTILFLEG